MKFETIFPIILFVILLIDTIILFFDTNIVLGIINTIIVIIFAGYMFIDYRKKPPKGYN